MANKQWTAEDIEKIWNSTNNTAQATPQPAPIPVLKSKLDYEVKPYENKTYTAADVEKIWKNVERGKEVQAEMKAKANDTTPARFNKVPTKEELSRRNLAEGLDSASKSLNKDLKSIDRRNLTREEEAKLKKQEKEEKTARQAKVKQLNDVSKNMGDTNADRYNSRLSLNKPINNNKVNDPISVSYNQANRKEETSEIKQNLDKEVGNYFNTKDKTRENMLNNRKNEERFIKHMARSYGYSREDVKDYLKDYKNQALMSDYLVSRDRYDQLMQDGRLRNDLEPLAMAMANGSNAKNVGRYNIQSMGYNNVDDYIDQLSKRYELTSDEIKDMVKTYNSDREKAQAEKLSQGMYELGNNKGAMGKVMGTLMPLTYKGAAGVEGWYNVLNSLTTGDDRNQSHIFNAMANASQQGVADTMDSELAKNIYNFGVGGASAAMNAAAGPMGIAAQSGNAANEAMNSAIERGINPLAAGVYGGFAGGSDYLFNRVGFNAIEKSIGQQSITNAKGVVLKALTNFGIEGAENVAQDAVQSVADVILHGDNSELNNAYAEYIESGLSPEDAFANVAVDYAKQLGGSFVQGGIGGAIFGGIKGDYRYDDGSSLANRAAGKVMEYKANKKSQAVQDKVKASEIEDVKQDIEKFSNAAQEATATGDVQTAEALAQTVERLNTKLADLESEPTAEVPRVGKQPSLLVEDNAKAETPSQAELNRQALDDSSIRAEEEAFQQGERASRRSNDTELDDMITDVYQRGNNLDNDEVYSDDFKNLNRLAQVIEQVKGSDAYSEGRQSTQLSMELPFDTIRAEDGTHLLDATNNLGLSTVNIDDIDRLTDYFKSEYNRLSTPAEATKTARQNYFEGRNLIDNRSLTNKIKFDDDADNQAYQQARKDFFGAYNKYATKPDTDTWEQLIKAYNNLRESASKGYELDNSVRDSYRQMKKDFADRTKGMKIRLSDTDMAELTDLRYKDINKILSTFGNNTGLKVRKDIGVPIDSVWSDLVEASGGQLDPNLTNTQDMTRALVDYAKDIADKVNNPTTERIPADVNQYIPDEFWDHIDNLGQSAAETPNRVMAEDIGLNPETRLDDEPNVIEEELEPRNPYRKDGVSQFATNTMINTKVFDADTVENNPTIKDMAKLVKEGHTDVDTFNGAMERVTSDGDKWMNDIIDGKYVLGADKDKADLDFDTGMVLLTGLRDAIDSSTDPAEIAALTAKRDLLYGKMQTFSTSAARILHAHRKWNNTAEGLTMAGNQLLGDQTDVWSTRNKNEVEKNQKIADDLSKLGKKKETREQNQKLKNAIKTRNGEEKVEVEEKPEPTFDEIKEQVKNTFLSNRVENITDEDVDYITGMLQAGATTKEIAQALNMKAATGKFGMSTEAQSEINRLYKYMDKLDPESKEFVEAQMEAFRIAANEVKSSASAVEKFDAWRYLAMLGNPKTMIRNIVGNTMFNAVTGFSNNVAAMGESALRLKNRTKAVLNPIKDRALMKATNEDFNNKRYASGAGDKYHSYSKGIESATSAFDNHILQFLEDLTNKGISDTGFVRAKYGTSLAGYMKANGLTQKDLEDSYKYDGLRKLQRNKNRLMTKEELAELERTKPIAEKMEKARDYALEQAKYATFHEDSIVADKISQHINDWKKGEIKKKDGTVKTSKIAKAAGYALEGIMPFRKTPANILRSGFEYSPLGAIKSISETGKLIYENTGKRKNYDDTYYNHKGELVHKTLANDVIEDWSKNLTGSLMSMLGYYLFSKGVLKDSDKDTKYQDSLEGLQNYSIQIGNKTYTVDWAAPACMPLLLGAEIAKINRDKGISDKKFYDDPERYWEVANRMFEPMVETSMLQGVKDTLETAANAAKYNEELSVPTLLAYNALTGYATQAIPTLSGQVSRFIDPTRRSTYTEREGVSGIVEKQVRKTMNKTPLSRLNQPYYDTYGRTQSNNPFEYSERFADEPLKNIGRGIGNALYQFASPSYIQNVNTTDADAMTREVYEAIKKDDEEAAKVFGQWQSVKKIDGQRVSDEDYAKFAQKRGETDYEIRDALAHDEWFKMLDNDEKAKILKSITGVANKVGEAEINPNFKTDDANYKAFSEGGVNALLDEYKDSVHNNRVKNELGTTSDFAKELYDSGDQKRLDLYKQGNEIAEQYGYDSLSEEEFLNYEKYGEAKLNKMLNYKATAKELGVNNNDTFKKLVDSGVSKDSIKQASDAITSVQFGKDEFGRDQYLPFSQETYDVYKSHGTAGLKDYAKIKQGKANYKTYYQAQKALPTLIKNADSYVKMFNALDGKAGSKANGEISQDELFQYFNGRDMTQAQVNAYWNAFGKISGDDAWKSVPVLKYNKKKGKTEWTTEKKK